MRVRVRRVGAVDVPLPRYQTRGAAGLDLYAALPGRVHLAPRARELIPTGVAIALPPGYEGQVRPRSGLALHHGVTVLNAPGTIDADFRGEIGIVLINHGDEVVVIEPRARIAQLVVTPVACVDLVEVDALPPTARGEGGYGSTGVRTSSREEGGGVASERGGDDDDASEGAPCSGPDDDAGIADDDRAERATASR
ncbi:MAG: dUTP diphosphatase [Myxococcota bacterium]